MEYKVDEKKGKYGIVDEKGKVVVPYKKYDRFLDIVYVPCLDAHVALVKKDGKFGLINIEKKEEIIPCKYYFIYDYENSSYAKVENDGKCGLINIENKKEIIPCKYKYIETHKRSPYAKVKGEGYDKSAIDLRTGDVVASTNNPRVVEMLKENNAEEILGLSDIKIIENSIYLTYGTGVSEITIGKEIVPFEDKYLIQDMNDNGIFVNKNGKQGVFNYKGEVVVPCEYNHVIPIIPNVRFFKVYKDGKCGIFNYNGEIVVPCEYDAINSKGNFFEVRKDGKYGILNDNGEVVIPLEWDFKKEPYDTDKILLIKDDAACVFDEDKGQIIPNDAENTPMLISAVESYFDEKTEKQSEHYKSKISEAKSKKEADQLLEEFQNSITSVIEKKTNLLKKLAEEKEAAEELDKAKDDALSKINAILNVTKKADGGFNV